MKNWVLYILKFIFLSLIVAFFLQIVCDNGLKKINNSIYNEWSKILGGKINADVLIMGSSRAVVSYNTEIVSRMSGLESYNLGFNAGGENLQLEKLKLYLKLNKKPKIIIQNIDQAHFGFNQELPEETQFIPFLGNNDLKAFLAKYDPKYNYLEYIPLLKYNNNQYVFFEGIVSNFKSVIPNNLIFNGFVPVNKKFKLDKHNLINLEKVKIEKQNISGKIDIMLKFYSENLNKDSFVFFVWAPEKVERLDPKFLNSKMYIKKILKNKIKANSNYFFIDMMDNPISYDQNCFYDTFHLNNYGAKIFTTELVQNINKIN